MKYLLNISLIVLSLMVASCGSGGGKGSISSGTTNVVINFGQRNINTGALSAQSIPPEVGYIVIRILAPDMSPIERTISVTGLDNVQEVFEVPNGVNRHFEVSAYSNPLLYYGDAYANLDGTPVRITINMVSVADVTPPMFDGVETAEALSGTSIELSWTAATDGVTPSSAIVYLIYISTTSGGQNFAAPSFTTAAGATTHTVTGLSPLTTYYLVVRAKDEAGNIDDNNVEIAVITEALPDTTSPDFDGLNSATATSPTSIKLQWTGATDNTTPLSSIIYYIYQAITPGGEDFFNPTYITAPGATSYTVNGLEIDTTYYFVVRAKDEAGNIDNNTVERSAATQTTPPPPPEDLLTLCLDSINNGNIVEARDFCRDASDEYGSEVSNDADTARFFYALTRVFALWFDIQSDGMNDGLNDAGDVLDAFGCTQSGRDSTPEDLHDMFDLICPDIFPSNSPTGKELQDFLYNVVRPELMGAIANFDAVSQSFNITWTEPFANTTVESDYGDVLAFRAAAKGAVAAILIQYAYDLDIDIDAENNSSNTKEVFFNTYPNFLTLTNPAHLATAKSYLTSSALDDLDAAIDWILAEADNQSDDLINLLDETQEDIDDAKDDIATSKACISGQCTADDNDTPSDTSDDTIIDLSPFFAGLNLRSLLPSYVGDDPTGFLPDPTFGGVLIKWEGDAPNMLNNDLDGDGTADIFEEDIYYVYGGDDVSGDTDPDKLNLGNDPEAFGFVFLGVANAATGATDFSGAYSYYVVKTPTSLEIFEDSDVLIDAFEFLGSGEYCCSLQWWSYNLSWYWNVTGAPDSIGAWLENDGFVLMTAPPETTGIRVYGLP